jgi:hypothetical protein
MQTLVDRRFYRRKYYAARTLAAFNSRLREETDLNTLTDDVMSVVREHATGARLAVAAPRYGPEGGAGGLAAPYAPECVEGTLQHQLALTYSAASI